MKKSLISIISIVLILVVSALGFSGCGKKEEKKVDTVAPATSTSENNLVNDSEEDYDIVYVIVTDKNGNYVTNKNNEAITETSKVYKTKKATNNKKTKKTVTQEVKGGTDPYVEDPF